MNSLKYCLLSFMFISMCGPVYSQTVDISGSDPKGEIVIRAEETSISDVLNSISLKYDLPIEGVEKLSSGAQFSTTFKGSLDSILFRLLKNINHLVIRSKDTASGFEKIVILQGATGDSSTNDDEDSSADFLSRFSRPQK